MGPRRWLTTVPMIINGEERVSATKYAVHSHQDPREIIHEVSVLESFDRSVPEISAHAVEGWRQWLSKLYSERAAVLEQTVVLFKERKQALIDANLQIGVPGWFSNFQADAICSQLQEYVGQISRPEGQVVQSLAADLALVIKQPIGPVLSLSAWNAPAVLGARSISAPLAAGCSVVVKSNEKAPLVSYLLVKCYLDAGVPAKALQLVNIMPGQNAEFLDSLLEQDTIRKMNFTGSTAVGRDIAAKAGQHLVPCLLELGGKNSTIVTPEADLKKAAATTVWSSWGHKGQICMSTDKVFVHESIYDEFKQEVVAVASEMARDPDYSIPSRDPTVAGSVSLLVQDALDKGATKVFGEDDFAQPLILEGVDSTMLYDKQEAFGPVFALYKYSTIENATHEVNRLGALKASVWSGDILNAIAIARGLDAGGVHINGSTVHDELTVPHGGHRSSGTGRFNSTWGIDEFCKTKSITIN